MAEFGQPPGIQYYLVLKIKGNSYNPVNIQYLIIREWIFNIIPTIEIQFDDVGGYLTEIFPLEDAEDIEILLGRHQNDANPIELTFSLDDYNVSVKGDNRLSIVTMTGHLKVDNMFTIKTRAFPTKNSRDVCEQIASEAGLTFSNPHNVTPFDSMTWYQNSLSNFHFIKHVLKRTFVQDDVVFFFANTSKEFVYTSLNVEIGKKDIKKSKFSVEGFELNVKNVDDPDDTIWFNSYSIVNNSGYFNKKNCYGFSYSYYDLEKNIDKDYSAINKKLVDYSFRNKNLAGQSVDKISNIDYIERNLYGEKYFESIMRNQFLKNNFFANSVVLNVNSLSQVKLMDTIDVYIPSLSVENESNEVMSGFYLVAGIQHEVTNGGIYTKKLALGRNGMDKSSNNNQESQVETK